MSNHLQLLVVVVVVISSSCSCSCNSSVTVVVVLWPYRWLKYEERVEIGERWSKPHVSTTSLRGLLMLRDALIDKECTVGLGEQLTTGQFQVAGRYIVFQKKTKPLHFYHYLYQTVTVFI